MSVYLLAMDLTIVVLNNDCNRPLYHYQIVKWLGTSIGSSREVPELWAPLQRIFKQILLHRQIAGIYFLSHVWI